MKPADDPAAIRRMEEGDFPFVLSQTAREGWDPTREVFEIHLAHDPEGCYVAEVDGRPVGIVTTTRYGKTGWIGELIVSPDHRQRGIGTLLMNHGIGYLESTGARTIRLEADPPGFSIYEKLGFVPELVSPRFRLEHAPKVPAGTGASVTSRELSEIAAFDEPKFGDDRRRFLGEVLARARAVYQVPRQGPLSGYLVVQRSAAGARIGPWVAADPEDAEDLLRMALSDLESETVIVALPGVNTRATRLLMRLGFFETAPSFRMVRGPLEARGHPEHIYAIASGAFG